MDIAVVSPVRHQHMLRGHASSDPCRLDGLMSRKVLALISEVTRPFFDAIPGGQWSRTLALNLVTAYEFQ
jgi:hypothetical protein